MIKYLFGVLFMVAISLAVSYVFGVDVAVAWAAICTTISLYTLVHLYPKIRAEQPHNAVGNTAVLTGMLAGFITPVFIYVITPLAFGGLVGVGVSAVMQAAIGYRSFVKSV